MYADALWSMCPYCAQPIDLWIDAGGGARQQYIEDCSVCCRPIMVTIRADEQGQPQVELRRLDD